MKNEFEKDPLLANLKRASQVKSAPKISEDILIRVSAAKSPSPIRKLQTPRLLGSLVGGAAVLAVVASLSVSGHDSRSILSSSTEIPELSKTIPSGGAMSGLITADTQVFLGAEALSTESYPSPMVVLGSLTSETRFKSDMAEYFGFSLDELSGEAPSRGDTKMLEISTDPVTAVNFSYEDYARPTLSDCSPKDVKVWNGCLPLGAEGAKQIKLRTELFLKDIAPELEFTDPKIVGELTNLDEKTAFKEFEVEVQLVIDNQPTPIVWHMLWNSRGQLLNLYGAKFAGPVVLASFPGKPVLVKTVSARAAFERWNKDDVDGQSRFVYSVVTAIRQPVSIYKRLFADCAKEEKGCHVAVTRAESTLGMAVASTGQLFLVPSYDFFVGDTYVGSATALEDPLKPTPIN